MMMYNTVVPKTELITDSRACIILCGQLPLYLCDLVGDQGQPDIFHPTRERQVSNALRLRT